jgi:very-short-patch-repair endonuclease
MRDKNKACGLHEKYMARLLQGSKASTQRHAAELRKASTPAEQNLWGLLRNRQLKGRKFRRQHPLANYVLDFYCHECKLAIELDGNYHKQPEVRAYDDSRTALLKENGITVLRFWNDEVFNDMERVLETIALNLG